MPDQPRGSAAWYLCADHGWKQRVCCGRAALNVDGRYGNPPSGARNGQRLMLTRGPNRLIGRVSSDSGTWITLRLDTGCSLAIDLDGWSVSPEPVDRRPRWAKTLHRWFAWVDSPLTEPPPWGPGVARGADGQGGRADD